MSKTIVLVIEDDSAIRQGIVDALAFEGYETLQAADFDDGLDKAMNYTYDLVLLDLVIPGDGDGFGILRVMREARPTTPVIILTARGAESDRVVGLKMGADDYVVKPFSVKELMARVQAVLRRSPERPRVLKTVEIPGGRVDLARGQVVYADGTECELSEREAELLEYLASNAGRVISRDEILNRVWRMNPRGVETRTIDMHVARLRDKLNDKDRQQQTITTVRGRGYMFSVHGDAE